AAALGESYFGFGKRLNNFLFLSYGTGIGGAIIHNNQIYHGEGGFAGEFGHMITHYNGRQCSCGMYGCYEAYASVNSLIHKVKKVSPNYRNGKLIIERWYAGDREIQELISDWIDEIVIGLISSIHIFNPSTIVVGGGIMEEEML